MAAAGRSGLGIRGPKDNEHPDQLGGSLSVFFCGSVGVEFVVPGFRLVRDCSSGI